MLISIHSLHTEGDALSWFGSIEGDISIHSLHTEGDIWAFHTLLLTNIFQSTPSTRRETNQTVRVGLYQFISIHSLHTEGDATINMPHDLRRDFNPLPPHGGRQAIY